MAQFLSVFVRYVTLFVYVWGDKYFEESILLKARGEK